MSTKRIFIRSGKSPFRAVSPEQMMHTDAILSNSGNLLFQNSVHKMLMLEDTEVVSNNGVVDPDAAPQINAEFDVFAVPLANAFRPTFERHLVALTKLIEQLTIPVVVIGVGGQAGLDFDFGPMRPLDESVTNFTKAVLDRSASIGVRGEFTARYLADLGFHDVEVIGCPSMFLYGAELDVRKRVPELTSESPVSINISRDAPGFGPAIANAVDRYANLLYIAQEMKDARLMYWGDLSEVAGREDDLPVHRTHPLLRDGRTRMYIDPGPWIDDLRRYQFTFGTRIHGNIASLLAGTPCTVICHDSRTLELCEYFSIPYRTIPQLSSDTDPAELYAEADFDALLSGHQARFERMLAFLETNGLPNTYTNGDGGAAFEKRLRSIDLPRAIEAWDGAGNVDMGYRIARLRESESQLQSQQGAANKKIADLNKKAAALEKQISSRDQLLKARDKDLAAVKKRLAALESRARNTLYRRVRRKIGRPIRAWLNRRRS